MLIYDITIFLFFHILNIEKFVKKYIYHNMDEEYIIGIDLGTTNSCVGVWKNGRAEIIPNPNGNRITPSYVCFKSTEILIGDLAKYNIVKYPENTIYDVKRMIGRQFSDENVQNDMKLWPFKVINESNRPKIKVEIDGETNYFLPQQISSMILLYLKNSAEDFVGKKVTDAVITVPAYFNEEQKKATKEAGIIAGLNVLRLINEPTAAAIAYGLNNHFNDTKNILVFDLGGGTFDVSVLHLEKSKFTVLSINGDTHLGGEDFDNKLLEYCAKEFEKENGINIMNNKKALRRLKRECEKTKIDLSNMKESFIDIDSLEEGCDFNLNIDRVTFEHLCEELFQKCLPPMTQALEDAKLNKNDINDVILVGGSSRIPKIQEIVRNYFNGKIKKMVNVDEVVAEGATIQAAIIKQKDIPNNIIIKNINPISLGIDTLKGKFYVIIPKNTTLPCSLTKKYITAYDNQTHLRFDVYQGERYLSKDNYYLNGFSIKGLRKARKGEVEFNVTMELDEDGILTVSAKEINGSHSNSIQIEKVNELTHEQLNYFKEQELIFQNEDNINKQKIEAKEKLINYIYERKRELEKNRITNFKIIKTLEETEKWLRNQSLSVAQITNKLSELSQI